MKTRTRPGCCQFQLKITPYEHDYYLDRISRLERLLARKPRAVQINLAGTGEFPSDSALLLRSVLMARSPRTRIITNARSSLQGGSVLVWLLGDRRAIRDDAKLFFRRANLLDLEEPEPKAVWKDEEPSIWEAASGVDPDEGDYVRVLELINEFLPVRELAGRLIGLPVLRQFGLVENEQADRFLANVFGKGKPPDSPKNIERNRIRKRLKDPDTISKGKGGLKNP